MDKNTFPIKEYELEALLAETLQEIPQQTSKGDILNGNLMQLVSNQKKLNKQSKQIEDSKI
jgi:hypothetical protein